MYCCVDTGYGCGISACVDDNKTLYDPEYKTPNPMEEISAPTRI